MDVLTPPLEEDLSFLKIREKDAQIPLPPTDFLKKMYQNLSDEEIKKNKIGRPFEHEGAYDAYCRWYVLPTQLKKPKKSYQFESKWDLPKHYLYTAFHTRDDFKQRTAQYFFEWMMNLWPDVVYAIYKDAVKGSAPQARVFADIILKKMDVEKPKVTVSPMIIMGVPQEKIDQLFIPKEYESVKDITPK